MSTKAAGVKAPHRSQRHNDDHEEHRGGHERWLVTYADMVTLLMVLFIVMFAMSTVDQHKFDELKNGLANAFGSSNSILSGTNALADQQGASSSSDAIFNQIVKSFPTPQQPTASQALHQAANAQAQQTVQAAAEQVSRLMKIWHQIEGALKHQGLADDVRATIDQRGLVISLVSKHVVFGYDVATLTDRGNQVVDTIAPVLAALPEPIEIDGHTNQEKVHPRYYPTDWELSVARAVTVLRRMNEVDGIPAGRLEATGFGHTKPLMNPSKPGSQEINKRVDIVVLSQASSETRALFQKLYAQMETKP